MFHLLNMHYLKNVSKLHPTPLIVFTLNLSVNFFDSVSYKLANIVLRKRMMADTKCILVMILYFIIISIQAFFHCFQCMQC